MSERKLWQVGLEVDRPDFFGDYAEIRGLSPDSLAYALVEPAAPGCSPSDEVSATEEEVAAWAQAYEEFCTVADRAAQELEAAEQVFAAKADAYRAAMQKAVAEYQAKADGPISARQTETEKAGWEAQKAREEEKRLEAARLLQEEDERLGPREWSIFRPERKHSWEAGMKPDSWAPVIHRASCRIVTKNRLPGVRMDEVSDAALARYPEIKAGPRTGSTRNSILWTVETGKTLPVRWCGACRAAKTALEALGEAQPRWRSEVEQHLAAVEAENSQRIPAMDRAGAERFLIALGLTVHRLTEGGHPGSDGFFPVAPRAASGWKELKSAEVWTVRYRLAGGYVLTWSDMEDEYTEVLKSLKWVQENAEKHGYKVLCGEKSSYFTVRRMSRSELDRRRNEQRG